MTKRLAPRVKNICEVIMKNSKTCPKCEGSDIVRLDGNVGAYGAGNTAMIGGTIFSAGPVARYICLDCGYTEEWIDREDIAKIKNSKKAKQV